MFFYKIRYPIFHQEYKKHTFEASYQYDCIVPKQIQITVSPREAVFAELLETIAAQHAGCRSGDIAKMNILPQNDENSRFNAKIQRK